MDKKDFLRLEDVYKPFDENRFNFELTLWEEIEITFKYHVDNIRIFFKDIIKGVQNIVYYFPVIWKDRDWDYDFILDLLKAKLIKQRDYLQKENLVVETPKIVEEINCALQHINNFDNYYEVCDMQCQNELKEIGKTEAGSRQDNLLKNYFIKIEKIRQENWCKIFDTLKEHMMGWWI